LHDGQENAEDTDNFQLKFSVENVVRNGWRVVAGTVEHSARKKSAKRREKPAATQHF
jgi:hypothetical protein